MTETAKKPYFAYRSFRKELKTRERFAELGVRQFCIFPANTVNALGQPYSEYPPVWLWEHQYDFAALPVWASGALLSCHCAEAEKHTFRLKRRAARVVELFSGRTVAENCESFDYIFRKPETALFELIEKKLTIRRRTS